MGCGWFLDVYIAYAFKSFIRFLRTRGSNQWPVAMATVSSAGRTHGVFGCSVSQVVYTYDVEGSIYGDTDEMPFISGDSAEEYANRFAPGSRFVVRTRPGKPEQSIVREEDNEKHLDHDG